MKQYNKNTHVEINRKPYIGNHLHSLDCFAYLLLLTKHPFVIKKIRCYLQIEHAFINRSKIHSPSVAVRDSQSSIDSTGISTRSVRRLIIRFCDMHSRTCRIFIWTLLYSLSVRGSFILSKKFGFTNSFNSDFTK